ncbi:serine O-acetyltransferase [Gallibacterium anatis]|uniref:serine O-acetyltransferase n=1 Tax=Gallibacterium anatis TaxID=750 RepID=UPI00254E7D88|nr:hypothetical protein [Gallibacterium anatis]WIM85533.1 hypothetical protein QP020_05860 [Gallibacterium anatis]WKS96581.1 hypothetical protein NYR19_08690 [Gallibacterium anatis]
MKRFLRVLFKSFFLKKTRRECWVYLFFIFKLRKNKSKLQEFILMKIIDILSVKYTIEIGKDVIIEGIVDMPHKQDIVIGNNCRIGKNCKIYQGVTLGQNKGGYPTIKDNVIIYPGAKVIGNITVGNNVIIGANAVVVKDVADNQIVAGVPAKVIGENSNEQEFY